MHINRYTAGNSSAARLVVNVILDAADSCDSVIASMATVDAPLNPNQQNHRMNTPSAAQRQS